jgi:hypothetical protein
VVHSELHFVLEDGTQSRLEKHIIGPIVGYLALIRASNAFAVLQTFKILTTHFLFLQGPVRELCLLTVDKN